MAETRYTLGGRCCRLLRLEFCHYSRLCLAHHDTRAFAFTPWLPYRWYFQIFFLLYRWVIAIFFFVWLVLAGVYPANGGPKFFIFLTNWAFLSFNAYVTWAAIVSTIDFFREHVCCRDNYTDLGHTPSLAYERDLESPSGCCGSKYNNITWYHMVQWVLFMIGIELAVAITLLYWPLLYNPERGISGVNFNTHGSQGIIAVIELLFSGVPVRFYHFFYVQIFAAVYAIFSGIYDIAGGTNVFGSPYIYSILDYHGNPGLAVGLVFGVILIFLPIVHFLFYLVYIVRYWIIYLIYGKRSSSSEHTVLKDENSNRLETGTELNEM